jgi:hypothetical protein
VRREGRELGRCGRRGERTEMGRSESGGVRERKWEEFAGEEEGKRRGKRRRT